MVRVMRGWRRNKTAPAPQIAPEDRLIAAYSGFTEAEWMSLPELARKDAREHIIWRLP
jgi:hypothetical protein